MSNPQQLIDPDSIKVIDGTKNIPNNNLYAIVEPHLYPDWKDCLRLERKDEFWVTLFENTPFEHIDCGPVLIDLSYEPEAKKAYVAYCEEMPAAIFFTTTDVIRVSKLASQLKGRLLANTESTKALFRFYDPRMMLPLLSVISAEERAQLFPSINSIYWYSHHWLEATVMQRVDSSTCHQLYALNIDKNKQQLMQIVLEKWLNGAINR
ncbi:DUF4123 domain-containing protein [Enterovibrio sp. ZSDZ35]|uniref:DUF4123 domain-containing protein n=1 Tax=Enterovibrio qingdaonensis TaxID=2899818 RepID=A0ABT5QJD5_9GAMM|nr:DUF4123 domain-containing protein [Enterovibrio sp. ZSDZ35]MDD1781101.1 DUF4123 domain-containing protein [Enterovibrio sp. ZSDZ35]